VRKRFWVEIAANLSTSLLFILTLWWPDWLEGCLGVDPDGRSGSVEWLLLLCSALLALLTLALGGMEVRRSFANRIVRS
jgi:hypothetical protein